MELLDSKQKGDIRLYEIVHRFFAVALLCVPYVPPGCYTQIQVLGGHHTPGGLVSVSDSKKAKNKAKLK